MCMNLHMFHYQLNCSTEHSIIDCFKFAFMLCIEAFMMQDCKISSSLPDQSQPKVIFTNPKQNVSLVAIINK